MEINLPDLFEYMGRLESVSVAPIPPRKVRYTEFCGAMDEAIRRFGLGETYRGHGMGEDLEKYVAGDLNYQTFTVEFVDERSANRFRILLDRDPSIPFKSSPSTGSFWERYAPVRKLK